MTISPPGSWLHPISLPSIPTTSSVFILTSRPLCQPLINPFHPYCQSQHRLVHLQIRAVAYVAENRITRQIHSCRAALATSPLSVASAASSRASRMISPQWFRTRYMDFATLNNMRELDDDCCRKIRFVDYFFPFVVDADPSEKKMPGCSCQSSEETWIQRR
ncbi:hypothetical protein I7I48_07274 [Histoplasma ohiense]|nr:hypothetical protein I7I48_07274 [Histoplasma ohiense (nom. inval.)]